MDDGQIRGRIEQLVAEEHDLWRREEEEPGCLRNQERLRLNELKVTLDQCWDLLTQRRALANLGLTRTLRDYASPASPNATGSDHRRMSCASAYGHRPSEPTWITS